MDIFQIRGIIHFICVFSNLFFAFILWLKGKSKATFHLGWVAFFSALYSFTYGIYWFSEENELFWIRATWLGVFILPAYITFVYYFTGRTIFLKLKSFFWYFGAVTISYFALATPHIIESVTKFPYIEKVGPLEPVGRLYVITSLVVGFIYLFKEYFKSQGFRKLQIKYFILGSSIYAVGGIFFAGILPLLSPKFISLIDISAFLSVFWVGLTTYAIFKRELFEIRVILTELLVGLISLILLIQVFLTEEFLAKIFGFILFLLFCLISYLLIRATHREIKAKEILEEKVRERTKELEESKGKLEKLYRLTIGRELRMVELKKEIKQKSERIKELEEKLK